MDLVRQDVDGGGLHLSGIWQTSAKLGAPGWQWRPPSHSAEKPASEAYLHALASSLSSSRNSIAGENTDRAGTTKGQNGDWSTSHHCGLGGVVALRRHGSRITLRLSSGLQHWDLIRHEGLLQR